MEAVRTSETSVDNHFTRQYIPEDNSEHHTRRRENLKSQIFGSVYKLWSPSLSNIFHSIGLLISLSLSLSLSQVQIACTPNIKCY
jgi:hypothetical protein